MNTEATPNHDNDLIHKLEAELATLVRSRDLAYSKVEHYMTEARELTRPIDGLVAYINYLRKAQGVEPLNSPAPEIRAEEATAVTGGEPPATANVSIPQNLANPAPRKTSSGKPVGPTWYALNHLATISPRGLTTRDLFAALTEKGVTVSLKSVHTILGRQLEIGKVRKDGDKFYYEGNTNGQTPLLKN